MLQIYMCGWTYLSCATKRINKKLMCVFPVFLLRLAVNTQLQWFHKTSVGCLTQISLSAFCN